MFKWLIQKRLERYVYKYALRHPDVILVAISGSVGKTSTKRAIATVLSERYKVRCNEGDYSSKLNTPLAILGIDYPENTKSISTWMAVFKAAQQRVKEPADADVIVHELSVDHIGQMTGFSKYLRPDIGVVTAVAPKYMEEFGTVEAVAREELELVNFSEQSLINREDIDGKYAKYVKKGALSTYGTKPPAEYRYETQDYTLENGYSGAFVAKDWQDPVTAKVNVIGEHTIHSIAAAGAVAVKLGMSAAEIVKGLEKISAVPGRMNILRGQNESIIIDDTYSSNPMAAEAALQALYQTSVPQRIAVLGSMNGLGDLSMSAHETLGKLCDPAELAWVVVVGEEAERYLAPAARSRGCQVKSCKTAIEAGSFVHKVMENGAAILFKGSKDGIFLEEAVKIILHSTDDEHQLVRQTPEWLERKTAFFND